MQLEMLLKNNHRLFLGLDTSAYTTSLALVDGSEKLIWDRRLPLPVKEGQLGLRQSEAVFEHLRNLTRLKIDVEEELDRSLMAAVAASARPRPVEDSYMPVFKVSEALGSFLSQTMGLKLFPSTHQEGHIMAGLWSSGLKGGPYLTVHLSGGTTDLISVTEEMPGFLKLQTAGSSADLHAGQFVDRVGLALGLPFPAGPALEKLARRGKTGAIMLPVAVNGAIISFSGPASHAERLLEKGALKEDLARAVELCIAESLEAALNELWSKNYYRGLLMVGGVAANSFINSYLRQKFPGRAIYFARPEYAADNAVGLAVLAARRWLRQDFI